METVMPGVPTIDWLLSELKIILSVFGILAAITFVLWLLLFRPWAWEKESRSHREAYEAVWQKVMALPLEEASQRAMKLLSDPECFECEYSDTPLDEIASQLSPSLRLLASQFSLIRTVGGEAEIRLRNLHVSRYHPDYWTLGRGDEDGLIEVAVRLGQETVYEIAWGFVDRSGTPPVDEYPSIYHWIIFQHCLGVEGDPLCE